MYLNASRFSGAEFSRNVWTVTSEAGTRPEDMVKAEYWAHVAMKLRPFDKIEVRAEDGAFYIEFIVIDAGRTWAKVKPLVAIELDPAPQVQEVQVDNEYEYVWKGPHDKYVVIRSKDKAVIRKGLGSKKAAMDYILEHVKAVAA